jgi:hypothetical protein
LVKFFHTLGPPKDRVKEGVVISRQVCLMGAVTLFAAATVANAATIYTSDSNLADLTNGWSTFATFVSGYYADAPLPYTPTSTSLASGYRVVGNSSAPFVVAKFTAPVSTIRIFPSIDHLGASYDGYQYSIYGSNDGINYTELFDAISVLGSGEPFTLGVYVGTAPSRVNNVLTPGAGPGGTVGYVADFTFGQAYKFYAFGSSTATKLSGNLDQELSAIAVATDSTTPTPPTDPIPPTDPTAPEPATLLSGFLVLVLLGVSRARSRR